MALVGRPLYGVRANVTAFDARIFTCQIRRNVSAILCFVDFERMPARARI